MSHLPPPLEGIVIIVVDTVDRTGPIERAFCEAGAAVFVAHDDSGIREQLKRITPHFAVIDPSGTRGSDPQSAAWMLFSHESCRTIVYSSAVRSDPNASPRWIIDRGQPVSVVVDAIIDAVKDPAWLRKGGDDVKPTR